MSRYSTPDGEAMRRAAALSLVVEGLVVRTRGLVLFDHPELVAEVAVPRLLAGARSLLERLMAHVVQGRGRLAAGIEVQVGAHTVRLEGQGDEVLEVWETDPDTGSFVRGASGTAGALIRESVRR